MGRNDHDNREPGGRGTDPGTTKTTRERLDALGDKLNEVKARKGGEENEDRSDRAGALGMAFRLGAEMVVGVAIGGVIGWALDNWLGTAPAFLIVFLLLGCGAGILNAVRTAQRMQPQNGDGRGSGDNG